MPDFIDETFCCTSRYQCKHLFIPRANAMELDRCLRYKGAFVDRDDRRRPVRIAECEGVEIEQRGNNMWHAFRSERR